MLRPLSAILIALTLAAPARARPADPASRAQALYQRAERELARHDYDMRRMALRDLEQATLLAPGTPAYELELARAYYTCGFLSSARARFERVAAIDPSDADSQFGLAQIWRRDWLKYLDATSLARALDHLERAARLRPDRPEIWLLMVPMRIERHELDAAADAAAHALAADSTRPEAMLAVAYTAWRRGEVARADSLFARAVPRLRRTVRERFEDIAPVASETDTMTLHHLPSAAQPEFVRRFWQDNDPDPATPENEARLEYWSRVTHAYFLYYDPRRRDWDERGEMYVRYGAPPEQDYNPAGEELSVHFHTGAEYPANVLVWNYPALGMKVTMQDRLLSEYYLLPYSEDLDPDPAPDPDSLASQGGELAMSGGRGVFPRLPPGVQPMPVEGAIARFEDATPGSRAGRLLAQLAVPGGDSAWAEWVVVDSTRHEVLRAARPLAPDACGRTPRQVASFSAELPPGPYTVGVSVRDAHHRRGVYRETTEIEQTGGALALSDVVVTCGAPEVQPASSPGGTQQVQLPPDPARRVEGGALDAYFEIYHLRPAENGLARFEYELVIRSTRRDPRVWLQRLISPRPQTPPMAMGREEQNLGDMRRQYLSVPIGSLPPGPYRLDVTVRDLVAGTLARTTTDFVRVAPAN
ncbi:MAG TPA: GWxTD domain-containing protein [Candidatus Eisenbacteria bacterium]|nr:GWxTD domain-containing protein [Candidatus Eisenbacteria bacterium]